MAKRKTAKPSQSPPPPTQSHPLTSYIPLIMLLSIGVIALYALFFTTGGTVSLQPPAQQEPSSCVEGQAQPCSVGSCAGMSKCVQGAWTSCRWERVCSPGAKVACVQDGCAYAYKECNACGSGYTPCK